MMRSDLMVHAAVSAALRRDLGATAGGVIVRVRDGVVTLAGVVDSADQKHHAERSVQQVAGVRAVAEELHVVGEHELPPDDARLAKAVADSLDIESAAPGRHITVGVEHGWVSLTGQSPRPRFTQRSSVRSNVSREYMCLMGLDLAGRRGRTVGSLRDARARLSRFSRRLIRSPFSRHSSSYTRAPGRGSPPSHRRAPRSCPAPASRSIPPSLRLWIRRHFSPCSRSAWPARRCIQ